MGIGNPDAQYKNTRHNIGHMLVDYLLTEMTNNQITNYKLVKTEGYMNNSGEEVKRLVEYYKLELDDLYVLHDDLDIPLGSFKIQKGVGPKDHNGIRSIDEKLSSEDYWRVRIGVDNREPENKIPGEDYVLLRFSKEEMELLTGVFEEIRKELVKQ